MSVVAGNVSFSGIPLVSSGFSYRQLYRFLTPFLPLSDAIRWGKPFTTVSKLRKILPCPDIPSGQIKREWKTYGFPSAGQPFPYIVSLQSGRAGLRDNFFFVMSGHSKWANIRVRKTAEDAKRGKIFTRHARLIEIAARAGGGDAGTNTALRTAIDNAREDNVPNANIERAIKKGTGALQGEQMQEMIYEAYGPAGTAYIIEALSDNRNRTIANVKNLVTKHGGRMAEGGAVAWMFERKGLVVAELQQELPQQKLEELELEIIDFGAEDFSVDGKTLRVVTAVTNWQQIRDFLKKQNASILSAGLSFIPKQKAPVTDAETAKKVMAFIDVLEEDDDVSEVHTNADISAEAAESLA